MISAVQCEQTDGKVHAAPFHRDQLEVSTKILRVKARDRQTVACKVKNTWRVSERERSARLKRTTAAHTEPGHRSLEVGSFEILFEVLRIGGSVPGVLNRQCTRERQRVCLGTHIQVHTSGSALRGMPPPSSEILIVMSCQWSRVGQSLFSGSGLRGFGAPPNPRQR